MKENLQQIRKLLPVPPVGLDRSWNSVEKDLGTNLPKDFKGFIDCYGTGRICGELLVWNFRDASYFSNAHEKLCGENSVIQGYERVRAEGGYDWPYKMYPEPGGLLPFATIGDVYNANWCTYGLPDEWDVVYWFSDGHEFIHLRGDSFSTFLLKMLRSEYEGNKIAKLNEPYYFTTDTSW